MVEALSNYEKSNFWGFRNPVCSNSTGSNQTEKTKVVYLLDLFEGRGEKGQCDLVCLERLKMTGLMVVLLFSIHVW